MEYGALMEMAVRAGEIMLASGAEVYRVEDTIHRILKHSGIARADVFVVTTGIVATIADASLPPLTLVKRGGKPGNEFEPHLSGKQCFKGILQRKIVRRGGAGTTGSDC